MQTQLRPPHRLAPRRAVLLCVLGLVCGSLGMAGLSGCYLTEPIKAHQEETPCANCHQADYDGTTSPKHSTLSYPSTCNFCHTQNEWRPTTFDVQHGRYYVLKGSHKTLECISCHQNTADYKTYECIKCHGHQQGDMDEKHKAVSGYTYASTACVGCHKTTEE